MHINRGQDAPCDGKKMRRENEILCRNRELLKHLRQMTVMEKAVGAQVLIDLGKMQLVTGLAACSRDAGLRIGNNSRFHVHPASFKQRGERKDYRSWIAAGI